MWQLVRGLQASGVTIILTTHYIDEAEQMADRIGVISKGEIILVEDKAELMRKLGKKQLTLHLQDALARVPPALDAYHLELSGDGSELIYTYDTRGRRPSIAALLDDLDKAGIRFKDLQTTQSSLEDIFVSLVREKPVNVYAMRAIYKFEMARTRRTLMQSIISPVISTSLYFVVFGAAIGSRIQEVGGISYGAFIVPGLIMLSLLTQSIANASFGIYFPKFTGTIYELLSAPVSYLEIVVSYVGAAATKSIILGLIILATAGLFVPLQDRPSAVDDAVPAADRGDVQPGRLHHRHLGRRLREAAARAAADHHAADVPGRQLLFDRHAAAVLADGEPVQSGGLPDQRIPLELLRHCRCRRRRQPRDDAGVHGDIARDRRVDLQDGVPPEDVANRQFRLTTA